MSELARRINYSKSYLSKIENDQKPPNPALARRCDAVLNAGGALSALVPAEPEPAVTEDTDGEVWMMPLDEAWDIRPHHLDRRQVLAGAGAMLGLAVTRGAGVALDDQVITVLRASFDDYRRLGMLTSPSVVLDPVIAQVRILRALAAANPEPVRSQLLVLASRVAEYASWLSQEAGDEPAALQWLRRAVVFAEAGQDQQMTGYALFREAEIAMYRHDAVSSVELARRAQNSSAASPRIRGLAARCEAQGHALAGDGDACERALDRAAEQLAMVDLSGANGLVFGSSSVTDEVSLARGWALYHLGRPAEAAEVLDQHVAEIPLTARRARARFGSRRALAHAYNGEIDYACVLAREVLPHAMQVDSDTIRSDLKQLATTLARWRKHDAVRELYPELTKALTTSTLAAV
jgi:transcriptional regulator with XRE-family HTH domain